MALKKKHTLFVLLSYKDVEINILQLLRYNEIYVIIYNYTHDRVITRTQDYKDNTLSS